MGKPLTVCQIIVLAWCDIPMYAGISVGVQTTSQRLILGKCRKGVPFTGGSDEDLHRSNFIWSLLCHSSGLERVFFLWNCSCRLLKHLQQIRTNSKHIHVAVDGKHSCHVLLAQKLFPIQN